MNMTPLASRIANLGVMPAVGWPITSHGPGAGPSMVSGPRNTSSIVMSRTPMRFVNQLESGTSPSVLTLTADVPSLARFANVLWTKS